MKSVLSFIALLFTPRRGFAYRELEKTLASERLLAIQERDRLITERDEYKERWVKAMNYALQITGKPRLSIAEPPPNSPPPVKLTAADIERKLQKENDRRFAEFEAAQKAREGAPNDVTH